MQCECVSSDLMILPFTSMSRRWLSSKDSAAAAADAVDTLLSFPRTLAQNAASWMVQTRVSQYASPIQCFSSHANTTQCYFYCCIAFCAHKEKQQQPCHNQINPQSNSIYYLFAPWCSPPQAVPPPASSAPLWCAALRCPGWRAPWGPAAAAPSTAWQPFSPAGPGTVSPVWSE